MKDINKLTPYEVRNLCYSAIVKELGIVGLLKFNQQYTIGKGDYTIERKELLKDYSIDKIVKDIKDLK